MNIYLIKEECEDFCIRAETMGEAILVCEKSYLNDIKKDTLKAGSEFIQKAETEYYYEQILLSCNLVSILKN